jgi:hypothetical protein
VDWVLEHGTERDVSRRDVAREQTLGVEPAQNKDVSGWEGRSAQTDISSTVSSLCASAEEGGTSQPSRNAPGVGERVASLTGVWASPLRSSRTSCLMAGEGARSVSGLAESSSSRVGAGLGLFWCWSSSWVRLRLRRRVRAAAPFVVAGDVEVETEADGPEERRARAMGAVDLSSSRNNKSSASRYSQKFECVGEVGG